MTRLRRILIAVVVVIGAGAIAFHLLTRPDTAAGQSPALAGIAADATPIERGRYLARAADCEGCHTRTGDGQAFVGGVPFKLPFGTLYSSNITPDAATGIGNWTADQFVRAVREGMRPDGAHLYPAFPYTSYTAMSRNDVLAIKAYLDSLPAVHATPPKNQLSFPFDQRWAMGFWNALFFTSRRFHSDPSRSQQWNRGHYLATALGHCGECHTARNFAFAMEKGKALSGETLQGWTAYNITSDRTYGIGGWSEQELAQYLRTGHAGGRGPASGPMGEVLEYSLQYLQPGDIDALVSYLRSVPARKGDIAIRVNPNPSAARASSADVPSPYELSRASQGLQLFAGACASCHQWNGGGRETTYAGLIGTPTVNDPEGRNATEEILHGTRMQVNGTLVYMPAFARGYSDAEIAAMANYVVGHFGGKKGMVTAEDVAKSRDF